MAANTKGAKLVDSGDEAGEALRSLHAEQHTRASLLDPSAHSGSLDPLQFEQHTVRERSVERA